MKTRPPHLIFAAILVASVAANGRATDVLTESGNIEPAVIRVAQSHGFALQQKVTTAASIPTLSFEIRGCREPLLIAVLSVTFEDDPMMEPLRERRNVIRYVYFGRSWTSPDRLAVFLESKKHKVLMLLGLSPYRPSEQMLLVALPPDCQIANAIDWRAVWSRDQNPEIAAN